MNDYLLISDAAKEVDVESHVLRYWEEELDLPIKRNELGHRFYTDEDIERFRQIKYLKERGLQLKAIKMILKDGKLDVIGGGDGRSSRMRAMEELRGSREDSRLKENTLEEGETATGRNGDVDAEMAPGVCAREKATRLQRENTGMGIEIIEMRDREPAASFTGADLSQMTREEKAKRLQWIIQQMMQEAVRQNNSVLCREIKESVMKELDYQFRMQEEREEERDKVLLQRGEEYYRRMDEMLRKKSRRKGFQFVEVEKKGKEEKKGEEKQAEGKDAGKGGESGQSSGTKADTVNKQSPAWEKKKRHFIF